MPCTQCEGIEDQFDLATARKALRRFRRRGPDKTTRLLVEALRTALDEDDVHGAVLLDIGAGVGAIHHELIDGRVARAVHIDASSANLAMARDEAERHGHGAQVDFVRGDFVAIADRVPAADVVTLDRVICCYHDMDRLVGLSADKATRLYGAVYPRKVLWMELGIAAVNLVQRIKRSAFRVFLHDPSAIDAALRAAGLERRSTHKTLGWEVLVYARRFLVAAVLASGAVAPAFLGAQAQRATCAATPASMTPAAWVSPPADQARAASTTATPLALVADVPVPGPAKRFDYQSFDSTTGRLYISHMYGDRLVVFDTRAQKLVASKEGFPGATGVWAVPELHRVYVAVTGRHEVAVVDDRTLAVVARVSGARFPDGIAYAPSEQKVFVSDESGEADLVIDARSNARAGRVALGGEAGNTHYDAVSHCIVVAVQTKNELVAIDPASERVVARYAMSCDHPHGFLIDEPNRSAFVSCQGDAKLLVVDLRTMRTTATLHTAGDPDVLALDPGLHRLYVGCESGAVTVFEERFADGRTGLAPLGEYRAPHAHSVSVDPATHRVYVPLQDVNGKPVLRILEARP